MSAGKHFRGNFVLQRCHPDTYGLIWILRVFFTRFVDVLVANPASASAISKTCCRYGSYVLQMPTTVVTIMVCHQRGHA